MKGECIFCKIVHGEIPASRVGETKHTFSILDAFPMSPGHVLVLTKKHVENFHDIPSEVQAEMTVEAGRLARLLVDRCGLRHYNVLLNSGSPAGQSVFHAHMHVIPRVPDDGVIRFRHGEKRDPVYYQELKEKLLA